MFLLFYKTLSSTTIPHCRNPNMPSAPMLVAPQNIDRAVPDDASITAAQIMKLS